IALAVCGGIGYGAHVLLSPTQGANADILGGVVGVLVIYVFAIADKAMNLNIMSRLAQQVIIVLIPPLALVFLVLGTIFLGIATPTEGGAMGAVGALILAGFKGRLRMDVITGALMSTTRLSAFVMFILLGARVFSLTFYGVNGHVWVEHLLTSLPGGEVGFLIAVNFLVFFLAFFLDFFELAFIIVPLLAPAATAMGIDLIWFGVLLGVNMQTSFMHPPFGFALFFLRSVAARVPYLDRVTGKKIQPITTGQIYWGAVPFVGIQLLMVALVIIFPGMVMHYKGNAQAVDPNTIQIDIPGFGDQGGGMPSFEVPSLGAPPSFGTPPAIPGQEGQP
ncbi:TRAP transporter large permease subunit, partial [Tianweitania populi]|uniref:TRAP transporter large permease subunit n=1 Tax=Tianweitania populi TaxID=1607949 RepID=UPI0016786834